MEWIFLVLALVVVVFGFGVLVFSRLSGRGGGAPPRRATKAGGATALQEPPPAPPRPSTRPAAPAATAPPPTAPPPTAPPPTGVDEPDLTLTDDDLEALLAEPVEIDERTDDEVDDAGDTLVIERPRFRDRLTKARAAMAGAFGSVRTRAGITDDTWDDLEEALLVADVGIDLTTELLDELRARVKAKAVRTPDHLLEELKAELKARLEPGDRTLRFDGEAGRPDVWLFVGVNGVGKTTTIGKVGAQQLAEGRRVVMAAGDTFRAAAAEQLETWAERAGADLVRGAEGGDPSAIIFDAVQHAAAKGADLVLADTAGRLQNKVNLMEELRKVRRVAAKEPGNVTEVLLVLDATTGQNGLSQAREFANAVEVTGVVLTKLDGSAKGGIVLAIQHAFGIPVKLVGLGETIGDLVAFDPDEFVDALFEPVG